mmetsp:Transcript_11508/g.26306  ORF Transcript_11508/g.26306 Transcript_11508/m.26306 type:complete len:291 (+) Transcript_11508:1406-2278(+)
MFPAKEEVLRIRRVRRRLHRTRNYPVLIVEKQLRYGTARGILANHKSIATQSFPTVSLDAAGFLCLEYGRRAEGMFIKVVPRVRFLHFKHEVHKITVGDVSMADFVCISVAVRITPAARIDRALLDGITKRNTAETSVGWIIVSEWWICGSVGLRPRKRRGAWDKVFVVIAHCLRKAFQITRTVVVFASTPVLTRLGSVPPRDPAKIIPTGVVTGEPRHHGARSALPLRTVDLASDFVSPVGSIGFGQETLDVANRGHAVVVTLADRVVDTVGLNTAPLLGVQPPCAAEF